MLNNIPKGTHQVVLRGKFDKVAITIANALCTKNIQVGVLYKDELEELQETVTMSKGNLALSPINTSKVVDVIFSYILKMVTILITNYITLNRYG